MSLDEHYMQTCLELACLGEGNVAPNPLVGCVVLDAQGRKVGEGYHAYYGGLHAEPMALVQAGERAKGGTLYVNLEPCNHTGKTPPCSQAVIAAGIKRVVFGCLDPNPKVSGRGKATLEAAGIQVADGVLRDKCDALNAPFFHWIKTQTPYVTVKLAMTVDGKVATRQGHSQWITSALARRWVHQQRAKNQVILTTAQTVCHDNPMLTVRDAPLLGKAPLRVILDRQGRIQPEQLALFQSNLVDNPVWVYTRPGHACLETMEEVCQLGGRVVEVPEDANGLSIQAVLNDLAQHQLSHVWVEAGGRFASSLIQQHRVQKLFLMMGNQVIGDSAAKPAFMFVPVFSLEEARDLSLNYMANLEGTLLFESNVSPPSP